MKTYSDLTERINKLCSQLFGLYYNLEAKYSNDFAVVVDLLKVAYQTLDIYFHTDCVSDDKRDVDLPLKVDDDVISF